MECIFVLDIPEKAADVLIEMLRANRVELCYQLAHNIHQTYQIRFVKKVEELVSAKLDDSKNIVSILSGEFFQSTSELFYQRNSHLDLVLLKKLTKKWKPYSSIKNTGIITFMGLMFSFGKDL